MHRSLPAALRRGRHAAPRALRGSQRLRRAPLTVVAVLAVIAAFVPGLASPAAASSTVSPLALTAGTTLSGVVGKGGQSATDAFGSWRGRPVQVVVNYLGTTTWDNITGVSRQGLTGYFPTSNAHRVWSVPMLPLNEAASLQEEAKGSYNAKFVSVAQQLVAGGDGSSTIRLGWEMSGDWYPWSGIKDPAAYVAAWRQVVTSMRSVAGAHFTFDWNPSIGFANPEPMYPGDSYVDFIGADNYDASWAVSYPPTDHVQVWNHIRTVAWGLDWLGTFATTHHKRLSFPEWGVSYRCDGHAGGDDPYFVQAFTDWMAAHDVAYEAYNNTDDSSCRKFAISTGTFPNAATTYKAVMSRWRTVSTTTSLDVSTIRLSSVADRAGSWNLAGSTLKGTSYIFVNAPAGTSAVRFYLDGSATAVHTESSAPFDFRGGSAQYANPLPLGVLTAGTHRLTVSETLANGSTPSATVSFATW